MDGQIAREFALRALPEAKMGETRVYNGMDYLSEFDCL